MPVSLTPALESLLARREAEGRPLTDDELMELVAALPNRKPFVEHYKAGREVLPELCSLASEHVCKEYPMAKFHQHAYEKGARDMTLLCWYEGDAMLLDDQVHARDTLTYWMRTIVQAFEFPKRTRRQFGPGSAAKAGPAPAAPAKRGLFGLGGGTAAPPTAAKSAAPADPFSDKLGQYTLEQVAKRKWSSTSEMLFEAYTFVLWKLNERIGAEAAGAWEPFIADGRDQICSGYEPQYAS